VTLPRPQIPIIGGGFGSQQQGLLRTFAIRPFSSQEKKDYEFQAETRQLLDIVTHSLYTDKEVFLRELISNASDALEKLRHLQSTGAAITDPDLPLEINITTNEANKTITIEDSGIGMTKEELAENLGTIARSGSRAFVKEMKEQGGAGAAVDAAGIIGQFGVGFYSAFMVGDAVSVTSKAADAARGAPAVWSSRGEGSFSLEDTAPGEARRGCRIVLQLREGMEEYCRKPRLEEIVRKYSNFVGFPIKLDGEVVNTVQAVWAMGKDDVTEEQYREFYRFVAHAYDDPLFTLHFRADAPLDVKALFFFPGFHTEKFGMGRMEPGVSLYSRKVLIEHKAPDLLPDWLRFVKGVADSEDLPLSVSREKAQDSRLLRRLGDVLTRKILRFLDEQARKDTEKYKKEFFPEFGFFLKEGICQDPRYQEQLSKLLYFETAKGGDGELSSLDDYLAQCPPEQDEIYYLCAPGRAMAEASPYYEVFKKENKDVFFLYSAIDDFVMTNLGTYGGKKLVTAESTGLKLGDDQKGKEGALTEAGAKELCAWLQTELDDKVSGVTVTHRLGDSPAIITDHESGALRRMMRMVNQQNTGTAQFLPKQNLEVNPAHPIITSLDAARKMDPELARLVAEQVFDNALVAAGLMDDARAMLPRLNTLLTRTLAENLEEEQGAQEESDGKQKDQKKEGWTV